MPRRRLLVGAVLIAAIGCCGGGSWAVGTVDHWMFRALDPGPFDPAAAPDAPDYGDPSAWAALPTVDDGADVFLPELPAIDQRAAPVDVFYVHPTTWVGPDWNGPTDDPTVIEGTTRGGTLIQASVFNACCAVYAPRYRQANGKAYVAPDTHGDRAIDLAYGDVSRAFDAFLLQAGERGFIVAGHSQGTMLATRLLRERVAASELEGRLVAAYLAGGTTRPDTVGGLPTCTSARQTGCVVAWNARRPGYVPGGLEFDASSPDTMRGRTCVNPLRWDDATAHGPAETNAGAVFFDTESPHVKQGFADARCEDGALVVTRLGDPERDLASKVLLWMMGPGSLHPIEYQLYYVDLRNNAADRADAWLSSRSAHPDALP